MFSIELGPKPLTDQEILDETIKTSAPPGPPKTAEPSGAVTFSISQVASYIAPNDALLVYLANVAYMTNRPISINDLSYYEKASTVNICVYTTCRTVYIACRGTVVAQQGAFGNFMDDLVIATTASCELDIVTEGFLIMRQLSQMGYRDFKVCGHSLGGRAALCLSRYTGVSQCVALNAGAPVTAPATVGVSPAICTHYHIVGDIISTHVMDSGCKNVRIVIGGTKIVSVVPAYFGYGVHPLLAAYDISYLDPGYHSLENFLDTKMAYTVVTPQQEQNSLEFFWFQKAQVTLNLLSTLLSAYGGEFYSQIGDAICATPIPGADRWIFCKYQDSFWKKYMDFWQGFLGAVSGFMIGFLTLGPGGAIEGARAGVAISKGNIGSLLAMYVPGWGTLSYTIRYALEQFIPAVSDSWRGKNVDDVFRIASEVFSINNLGLKPELDAETRLLYSAVTGSGSIPNNFRPFKDVEEKIDAAVRLLKSSSINEAWKTVVYDPGPLSEQEIEKSIQK